MAADADISIPCGSGTVVTEALCHTGIGFTLPDLHVDVQRRNFQCANAAILALHILDAGVGRLTIDWSNCSPTGNNGGTVAPGVNAIAASPGRYIYKLLQTGQMDFLHRTGLRSAEASVGQFRNLVIRKIGAAVVVR